MYISLRLDGTGFSKFIPRIVRAGLLEGNGGYSPIFADIMQEAATTVMTKFHGVCAFTQSDEMTILVPPANVVRGKQEPHVYNGRVAKLGTLASSLATSVFCRRLFELHQTKDQRSGRGDKEGSEPGRGDGPRPKEGGRDADGRGSGNEERSIWASNGLGAAADYGFISDGGGDSQGRGQGQAQSQGGSRGEEGGGHLSQQLMPTFDCRIGCYNTQAEALSLILWRAYDCSINSVSDAVHHSRFPPSADPSIAPRNEVKRLGTSSKLRWLAHHGALPLPGHQRDGSFFIKCKREGEGFDPRTNKPVKCMRSVTEKMEGNVLRMAAEGTLLSAAPSAVFPPPASSGR